MLPRTLPLPWRNAAWVPLGALAAPHALPLASMPAAPVNCQLAVVGSYAYVPPTLVASKLGSRNCAGAVLATRGALGAEIALLVSCVAIVYVYEVPAARPVSVKE